MNFHWDFYEDHLAVCCFLSPSKIVDGCIKIDVDVAINLASQEQCRDFWNTYGGPTTGSLICYLILNEDVFVLYSWLSEEEYLRHTICKVKRTIADMEDEDSNIETCEKIIKEHINDLHTYNDLKDVGQLLLGKIAEYEGTTTKEQYSKFGLNLEE